MGNAASGGLPFKLGDKIDYDAPQGLCELLRGNRTDREETVAVFKYPKPSARLPLAQKHFTKLRTLKHPYIVSYIDGVELDDSVMVVTEEVTPLLAYIKLRSSGGDAPMSSEEMVWGLKCVCQGLAFLHSSCGLLHGYLGAHCVFVSKTGDWKIGCFDLTVNLSSSEEEVFFASHENILPEKYRAPERSNLKSSSSSSPFPVDVFSLGVTILEIFKAAKLEVPSDLEQLVRRMGMSDARRRPGLALVLKSACFSSDNMALLAVLDELMLKSVAEASEALGQFSTPESVAPISTELCSSKLLPCVGRILSTSIEEFALRDSREAARQAIQAALGLLSVLGSTNKLTEKGLSASCLSQITALWTLTDRAVRTALLKTLPTLAPFMSSASINSKVFEPLINGFADNNLKMREDTLKSLVCLLDKLDEKNLQEKLVRCMGGLQGDAEAAIRTNATIFLGRIAPKLKDAVKAKVLCAAYAKAIKDPFLHCRVAGLKAALAGIPLLVEADYLQLVGKLLPQVCTLLTDKAEEIRRLALQFVDDLCVFVREKHAAQAKLDEAAAARIAKAKSKAVDTAPSSVDTSASDQSSAATKQDDSWGSSWTSWAVESISKSLEQATVVDAPRSAEIVVSKKTETSSSKPKPTPAAASGWGDDDDGLDDLDEEPPAPSKSAGSAKQLANPTAAIKKKSSSDFDEGLGEADDDEPSSQASSLPKLKSGAKAPTPKSSKGGWDDDDDDWDPDDQPAASKPVSTAKLATSQVIAKTSVPTYSTGWEDDDDWDEEIDGPRPAAKTTVSSTKSIANKGPVGVAPKSAMGLKDPPVLSKTSYPADLEADQMKAGATKSAPRGMASKPKPVEAPTDKVEKQSESSTKKTSRKDEEKLKPKVAVKKLEVAKEDWDSDW